MLVVMMMVVMIAVMMVMFPRPLVFFDYSMLCSLLIISSFV